MLHVLKEGIFKDITEDFLHFYYTNGESFFGLSVVPEYQDMFESLTNEVIEYYNEQEL